MRRARVALLAAALWVGCGGSDENKFPDTPESGHAGSTGAGGGGTDAAPDVSIDAADAGAVDGSPDVSMASDAGLEAGDGRPECSAANECPAPANECSYATCVDGGCGSAPAAAGTALSSQV